MVRDDVLLGIGDDAAIMRLPAGMDLVTCSDVLLQGVHFPDNASAAAIAHKALAVNLSDIAAMGAEPLWFTLNLSLPQADSAWLQGFCEGLFALAQAHSVQLVGGDTVRGPLCVGIQVHGMLAPGQALTRSGARPGDDIYVTGVLGDAALGLACHQGRLSLDAQQAQPLLQALHEPQPRLAMGQGLRGLAHSCIDISDGLLADLGHILVASEVGASIQLAAIPVSASYRHHYPELSDLALALTHGDDYELCFSAPASAREALQALAQDLGVALTAIGRIEAEPGLRCLDSAGQIVPMAQAGHDHFASE